MTFLSNDSNTDHKKRGNNVTNTHKHLTHSIQLICINIISLSLLSSGGDSQNRADENPVTIDRRIDKEFSVYTGNRNFALNKLFDWVRGGSC